MRQIMSILSTLTSIYMLVIMVRIILTWFRGTVTVPDFLCRITDPYLNWFRRFGLRIGYLDISPVIGLAVLSILNLIFGTISRFGSISLGIILAITLQAFWSIASFLLIFIVILMALRLIAYLCNFNTYGGFWRMVDTISQPVLYRINRYLFGGRITNYLHSVIFSVVALVILYLGLRIFVSFLGRLLFSLPV